MVRSTTKAEEIINQMTLGKASVEKLEVIEDDDERVEAVKNLTKPRIAEMFVMYGNNFRLYTPKETLKLCYIVELNASGVLKNGVVL